MRVYLDNCCYNRPFDDQSQVKVRASVSTEMRIANPTTFIVEAANAND